ncbi:MAG: guanylate kinase [Dehalococcoidia bacterium]|nr:guanylate kinase [Dehalococcoidia bacterium]
MKKDQSSERSPLVFVISGPSGVGKDAVISRLRRSESGIHFAVTATSRSRRGKEVDGQDYHFIPGPDFERMVEKGDFLEWAEVYGSLYGVPKREVKEALGRGLDVLIKVDVQGAATLRKVLPDAVLIFVAPSSVNELQERLRKRNTEIDDDLERRIKAAEQEFETLPLFDYVVVNREGRIAEAVKKISAIIAAERCRVKARSIAI